MRYFPIESTRFRVFSYLAREDFKLRDSSRNIEDLGDNGLSEHKEG